jgi:lupus La protein
MSSSEDVKQETTAGEPSDLENKIINQIEYYFGDVNLRRDKFLKEEVAKEEGWVKLETLLTFNRLKALSDDAKVIVTALRKSASGLVDISEDEAKVRRSVDKPLLDLTDEQKKELELRIIHFKGFPADATLDQIRGFCSQYGNIESVEMRRLRGDEKKFKGCCFVTYATVEDANKSLASELKFSEDIPMLRENKVNYHKRKVEYHANRKEKKRGGSRAAVTAEGGDEQKDDQDENKQTRSGNNRNDRRGGRGGKRKGRGHQRGRGYAGKKPRRNDDDEGGDGNEGGDEKPDKKPVVAKDEAKAEATEVAA